MDSKGGCSMISFNLGVPTCEAPILVEGYGICQFRYHYENGEIDIYAGNMRTFRVPGSTRWKYAK